jgi:hypothetical protein
VGRRPLIVHVDRPELLEDLIASFRHGGCAARRTGPRSCAVELAPALDEHEARIELAFFLRAWRARHGGVRALLAP